ncbi:hypothetical protein Aph02nite_90180 [Actinoplanes philippinensis]|nr:hypothetical protein Aph02nite_90180 [Actinoplanes philippinensis]
MRAGSIEIQPASDQKGKPFIAQTDCDAGRAAAGPAVTVVITPAVAATKATAADAPISCFLLVIGISLARVTVVPTTVRRRPCGWGDPG